MNKQQSGFTLVEIAIVLVIIGLLLGGVLKGQELINSAKVKNMAGDFRTISSLVYGYQDRFRSFPGDQSQTQLDAAFGAPGGVSAAAACTPAAAGLCAQNNGRIDGNWSDGAATGAGTVTSEASLFWQHVRLANLAAGATVLTDTGYRPRNADGGFIGIETGISAAGLAAPYIGTGATAMRGTFFVCSAGVLGRFVKQIDSTMDDGNTAAGTVQAVPDGSARGTAATTTANIADNVPYTVCVGY